MNGFQAVILFARTPLPGKVKTRLHPALGPERAALLHTAFVQDQIDFLRSIASPTRRVELCLDTPWPELPLSARDVPVTLQGPGDLGDRLERALDRVSRLGSAVSGVVGADAPTVPSALLEELLAALDDGAEVGLIPACDGGYVAVAVRGMPRPEIFRGIPWGSSEVLAETRRAARKAGIRLAECAPWFDVDRPSDLGRLVRSCRDDPARAPRTWATLREWGIDVTAPRMI